MHEQHNKFGFLFIAFIFIHFPLVSAEWVPIVQNYGVQDYHAGTQNWSLAEQHNGWIYAANNHGLLEFDGCRWNLYSNRNSSAIHAICIDSTGRIFAGGRNEYGYFFPDSIGRLKYHSISISVPEAYKDFGEVWHILSANGYLFVQTNNWLFCYDKNGKLRVIDPADEIYYIANIDNVTYIATSRDIYVLTNNGKLLPLHGTEELRGAVICSMLPYKDQILIATDFSGLFLYNEGHLTPFVTEVDKEIKENQLYTATITNNQIILGTVRGGAHIIDYDGVQTSPISQQVLQNNTVLSLLVDKNNRLWYGLDCGIGVMNLTQSFSQLKDDKINYGSGYTFLEYKNEYYLGTNQGLYYQSNNSKQLQLVAGSLGQVWSLGTIGNTLFCAHHRGLFIVDNHKLTSLIDDGCWSVKIIDDSHAYVGSYHGFYYLYKVSGKWQYSALTGFDETSLYYEVDSKGQIWVLSRHGILSLSLDSPNLTLSSKIHIQREDASSYYSIHKLDRIYICGNDSCYCVDDDGVLQTDSLFTQRLTGNHKYHFIEQDDNMNIWFAQDNSIHFLRHNDSEPIEIFSRPYFFIDGFPNHYINKKGQLIAGAVDGFYCFQNTDIESPQHAYNVYMRELSITNPHHQVVYNQSYNSPTTNQVIHFNPNTYSLHFYLSSNNINNVKYRTRLLPTEIEFTSYSTISGKDLTNISSGNYQLEVQLWQSNTIVAQNSYSIIIAQPWYKQTWAWIIYAILFVGFIISTIFYIKDLTRRKAKEMQRIKDLEIHQQQVQILQLEKAQTQYQLKNKSQELSNMLLTEVDRKERNQMVLNDLHKSIHLWKNGHTDDAIKLLQSLQTKLAKQTKNTMDWRRFETNFDIVHEQFIAQLKTSYPWMNQQELRLCIYIKMGLQSKEIAPLMNISTRGVEMLRYRTRQKMNLPPSINLQKYFNFDINH